MMLKSKFKQMFFYIVQEPFQIVSYSRNQQIFKKNGNVSSLYTNIDNYSFIFINIRNELEKRRWNGALHRVPPKFYRHGESCFKKVSLELFI